MVLLAKRVDREGEIMARWFLGASGGEGGGPFNDDTATPSAGLLDKSRVASVRIRSGDLIDAIQVTIQLKDTGQIIELPRNGGGGGGEHRIDLTPNQFISQIRGNHGKFVDSMTITVRDDQGNAQEHGPFGGSGGSRSYVYSAPFRQASGSPADNCILGFWGHNGIFVDELGVILLRPR